MIDNTLGGGNDSLSGPLDPPADRGGVAPFSSSPTIFTGCDTSCATPPGRTTNHSRPTLSDGLLMVGTAVACDEIVLNNVCSFPDPLLMVSLSQHLAWVMGATLASRFTIT
jgi:hypothetical protein